MGNEMDLKKTWNLWGFKRCVNAMQVNSNVDGETRHFSWDLSLPGVRERVGCDVF